MEYTNNFVNYLNSADNNELQITPDRVFYEIDDFTITQDTSTGEISDSITSLKDLWGKNLPKYINGMSEYLNDDIPVITQEQYLREIKDYQIKNKVIKPRRFTINLNNSTRIDSVIIINKYQDHYVLMNEVFINDNFVRAVEYNFNKVIDEYTKLMVAN